MARARHRADYVDPDELAATQAAQHYYSKFSLGEVCPVVDCETCRSDEWIREYVRTRESRSVKEISRG